MDGWVYCIVYRRMYGGGGGRRKVPKCSARWEVQDAYTMNPASELGAQKDLSSIGWDFSRRCLAALVLSCVSVGGLYGMVWDGVGWWYVVSVVVFGWWYKKVLFHTRCALDGEAGGIV